MTKEIEKEFSSQMVHVLSEELEEHCFDLNDLYTFITIGGRAHTIHISYRDFTGESFTTFKLHEDDHLTLMMGLTALNVQRSGVPALEQSNQQQTMMEPHGLI